MLKLKVISDWIIGAEGIQLKTAEKALIGGAQL